MAGCGGDVVFLGRPWSADSTVVLLATDATKQPLANPTIARGDKVQLDIEADPPFSLYAWVYAPAVLQPSCTIGVGGEGVPIPSFGDTFVAAIQDRDSPSEFSPAEAPGVDVKTTCSVPLPCPQAIVENSALDELNGSNVIAILPLAPEKLLVAGDQGRRILEIDGTTRRLLDTMPVSSPMRTLELDGDTVYGAAKFERFRFALADEIFETVTSTGEVRGLEVVPDGPPVLYGEFGVLEVFDGATTATAAIEELAVDVRQVRMIGANRGVLVDEDSMIYSFDGTGWTREQPGDGGFTLESFRRADGDDSTLIAVGKRENAFLSRDGVWAQLPPAFGRGVGFNDVVSLGGGSYFVVGDFGLAALYRDGLWCPYEFGEERDLTRVVSTADPEVLFVGTNRDPLGYPHLLRLTLE
jgi:hypothetical protein